MVQVGLIRVAKSALRSVDEYIASKPKDVRVVLTRVRRAIRTAVPAADETLSYQMQAALRGIERLDWD